jgi:hypothetical protein
LRRLSICSFIFCKEFPSWTRVEIWLAFLEEGLISVQ